MAAMEWQGAHVVVTGGSSGIGAAVARAAAQRRSRVTILARGAERLDAAATEIRRAAPGAVVGSMAVDVSDRDAATAAISLLCAQAGMWAVRVHDVPSTLAALQVHEAVTAAGAATGRSTGEGRTRGEDGA